MVSSKGRIFIMSLAALITTNSVLTAKDGLIINDSGEDLKSEAGGRDARMGEFPWMVALHYKGNFWCSAFIVTPKILLTAAKCVLLGKKTNKPEDYKGYAGTIKNDGSGTAITFNEIIAHSQYDTGSQYANDIALMKLAQPLRLNDHVHKICLPIKDSVYENSTAVYMGWKYITDEEQESSKILHTTTVRVPTNSMCVRRYAEARVNVSRNHICAEGNDEDKSICSSGSGGPLVGLNDIKPIAIGINSFGWISGCKENNVPIVFTATSMYIDWIVKNMGDDAKELCFVYESVECIRKWGIYNHIDYI